MLELWHTGECPSFQFQGSLDFAEMPEGDRPLASRRHSDVIPEAVVGLAGARPDRKALTPCGNGRSTHETRREPKALLRLVDARHTLIVNCEPSQLLQAARRRPPMPFDVRPDCSTAREHSVTDRALPRMRDKSPSFLPGGHRLVHRARRGKTPCSKVESPSGSSAPQTAGPPHEGWAEPDGLQSVRGFLS